MTKAQSTAAVTNVAFGWNLLGNGVNSQISVASSFGNNGNVISVWKWDSATSTWAFYSPQLSDGGASYASSQGYQFLTSINPGEGYWLNSKGAFTLQSFSSTSFNASNFFSTSPTSLLSGWNLISIGDSIYPSVFNTSLSSVAPGVGGTANNVLSIWAWDSKLSRWYFYSPILDSSGGLKSYISAQGYEDFETNSKLLQNGVGFWVNNPTTGIIAVKGTISGMLNGNNITLTNGAQSQTINYNGSFSFSLNSGSNYSIAVGTQPNGQICTVTNGAGTASSSVTNVSIVCNSSVPTTTLPPTTSTTSTTLSTTSTTVTTLSGITTTTLNYKVTTFAGSGQPQAGNGTGRNAYFNMPLGIAIDSSNNIYVADTNNNLIRKINPAGVVSTLAGSGSSGSTNGSALSASFNQPIGITVDNSGNVYVADYGNNLIRKISNGIVSTLAGSTTAGYADGSGTSAQFSSPHGITFDGSSNLYVADEYYGYIRKITLAGVVTTVAGSGHQGDVDGPNMSATFNQPLNVVTSGNLIYVAEHSSYQSCVRVVNLTTQTTSTLACGFPSEDGIALDSFGNVWVWGSSTITKITASGTASTFATGCGNGYRDGQLSNACFSWSGGLAFDSYGNLFMADGSNNVIRKVTMSSTGPFSWTASTFAGTGSQGSTGGPASSATFNRPHGVAFDSKGNLFVADQYASIIRKITPSGIVSTLAGSGNYSFADGVGTSASFAHPSSIAIDSNDNLYVSDGDNKRIRKVTQSGVVTTVAGSGPSGPYISVAPVDGPALSAVISGPGDLAFDSQGILYFTDGTSIRKIASNGTVTTIAGGSTVGSADGVGSAASFNAASGLVFDSVRGYFYVVSWGDNLIRKVTPDGVVTTFAGTGSKGSQDGVGTAASFYEPSAITIDQGGNLYVTDEYNNMIRQITPSGLVTTISGTGAYSSVDGSLGVATFENPTGITVDSAGNLFIGGFNDNKIRKLTHN